MEVTNKLNVLILSIKLTKADEGKKVLIRDIEEDIAKHCGVSRDLIVSIKAGRVIPSLTVALKLSEYFGLTVNDIFYFNN